MYNMASRLGIDGHKYVQIERLERQNIKLWLKDISGKSTED